MLSLLDFITRKDARSSTPSLHWQKVPHRTLPHVLQAGSTCPHWRCQMAPTILMKTQCTSTSPASPIQRRLSMEYPASGRFLLRPVGTRPGAAVPAQGTAAVQAAAAGATHRLLPLPRAAALHGHPVTAVPAPRYAGGGARRVCLRQAIKTNVSHSRFL